MVSIVFMLCALALGAYVGFALTWAITGNLRQGRAYREQMLERLDGLRLRDALVLRGLDARRYLHTEPMVDIHRQMGTCAVCTDTERCDENLQGQRSAEAFAEFCPNDQELARIGRAAPA